MEREDFFFPYFFREPGIANVCTLLQARQRQLWSATCPSLDSRFSALCLNLTVWFSSRVFLPVTHLLYPTALIVLPCLLITTWQFLKAHGVIRNELKIHGICYITLIQSIEILLLMRYFLTFVSLLRFKCFSAHLVFFAMSCRFLKLHFSW